MTSLEQLIPTPRLLEVSQVDLDAPPAKVWEHVRHGELADSPWVRALFSVRTLPSHLQGAAGNSAEAPQATILRIDDMVSTPEGPGFQLLLEEPGHSLCVGAIGQVWQLDIPFQHVPDALSYASFAEAGWVKVAWEIRVSPRGQHGTHLEFEVRVDATDAQAWDKFSWYWKLIGPGSHFIRHVILSGLKRRFGSPESGDEARPLAGDELLPDAHAQVTQAITIAAPPSAIWPWLLQMGCQRAGFYSLDVLDNGGIPSARELHPELQTLTIGQVLPAAPGSGEGFEVLRIVPESVLILGGLFDAEAKAQLPFTRERPADYWHVSWAFVLERVGETSTRLHVRARAAFSPSEKFHATWIRPVHSLMQAAQLRNLAQRAEGRLARDTWQDAAQGLSGAAVIALAALTPFQRKERTHWGLPEALAEQERPGDDLIPEPQWAWTHAVEIDAPPHAVWPWVAQLGADRAGFYSYQWLENLAGCQLKNAEVVHSEWAHHVGDTLVLHPKAPPIPVVVVEPDHCLVAFAPADEAAKAAGRPWAAASWAFVLEPLDGERCRLVSRFRSSYSDDLISRLTQGPVLLEPISFAMDRRMLLGIKERASRVKEPTTGHP